MSETATKIAQKAKFDEKGVRSYRNAMTSRWKFNLGMLSMLPLGLLTGMRVIRLDDDGCDVTVPYKYLNKNPFKTTYWAVLGMAAEMAGGAILLSYARNVSPSVATFVVGCDAKFVNRALGVTTFRCEDGPLFREKVQECIETGQPSVFETTSIGYSKDGTVVSEFIFTWSVKARSK